MSAHDQFINDGYQYTVSKKDKRVIHIYTGTHNVFAFTPFIDKNGKVDIGFTQQSRVKDSISFVFEETLLLAVMWIKEYKEKGEVNDNTTKGKQTN